MKPVSLTEAESVVIGTKFEYFPPREGDDEYPSNWRYVDKMVANEDLPILEALNKKRLVWHIGHGELPVLADEACWVLTDEGLGIFNWFHSFPENYGI